MEKSLPSLPGQSTSNNAPATSVPLVSVQPVKTGGFRAGFKNLIHRATSPSPDKTRHSSPAPPSGQSNISAQTSVASVTAAVSTLNISTSGAASIAPTSNSTLSVPTSRSTTGSSVANFTPGGSTVGSIHSVTTAGTSSNSSSVPVASGTVAAPSASAVGSAFIFPKNIDRTIQVPMIAINERFDTTTQLAHYAYLVRVLKKQPLSSSPSPFSALSPIHFTSFEREISKSDSDWIEKIKDNTFEQNRIRQLVVELVNKFLSRYIKDPESIREIVIVGPVLDKSTHRALLTCLLKEFDKEGIMSKDALLGIVQMVEDAPPGVLEVDDLISILQKVRKRLEKTAPQSTILVITLTQAISRVLGVMADQEVKDLDRVTAHHPVSMALSGLKIDDNEYLRYQAVYALQALRRVPDNETARQCFFRHFVKVTGDFVQLSRIMQMDFSGFVEGAVKVQGSVKDIFGLVKDGLDDCLTLKEDVQELIKKVIGSEKRNPWFMCLRMAEDFARQGRLVELSQSINEAPGHDKQHFQWGACQLLGEIAVDSSWDEQTRELSVKYLGQIYSTTLHESIKRWIVTLLNNISGLQTTNSDSIAVDEAIKSRATALAQGLKQNSIQPFTFNFVLGRRLPLPRTFPLLRKVYKIPDVENQLQTIKAKVEENRLAIYVPLMCKENLQASSIDQLTPLEDKVVAFLASEREVLLILGDSGAGKSTFNRYLEHKLWSEYLPGDPIPLFIDLKAMGKLNEVDMVKKKLDRYDFESLEIRELQRSRQVVLICDGYDECRQWINLHNRLKLELGWQSLKIIVTCRTQYLASTIDRIDFEPQDYNDTLLSTTGLFEEVVIVPFSDDQVQVCIEQFRESPLAFKVFDGQPIWSKEEYLRQLAKLMDLVKNPFMLQIALRTLPGISNDGVDMSKTQLTKFELYDKFTRQHFDNEKKRLSKEVLGMDRTQKNAFDLLKVNFPLHCMGFSKRLAFMLFMENDGVNAIEYSTSGEEQGWKDRFFGLDVEERIKLLRQSSQLIIYTIDGSSESDSSDATRIMHQFPHRSILEFLYACQLCDHGNSALFSKLFETTRYHTLSTCLAPTTSQILLQMHPLNQRSIVSEPSIISFLVEFVNKYPVFKEQLNTIVHLSKLDDKVSQAAANAITILVRAGVRFNNQDLRGIRIRGANLTGGQFDNTQLQGADLRDCNLRNTWLRQADLSHAEMKNAQFGEWPYIQEADKVMCCAYSSNGGLFVCGLQGGTIKVYDTLTWVELHAVEAHSGLVLTVGLGPDGLQIASGGLDKMVRLWDAQTGALELTLKGHAGAVKCVVYSPNGKWIASASDDKTVRIWDTQTGKVCMILKGHSDAVYSVAYSPDGQQIASGGVDRMIRIWNVQDGSICHILEGHTSSVTSIVYSPNGEQIASGSKDMTVKLWNALTGKVERTLNGHSGVVASVAYSPTGHQIVSGSWDRTVRLWDAKTGAAGPIMRGHDSIVRGVVYSPDGQTIASGSEDRTVRLWDTQITSTNSVFHSHTEYVTGLAFSPSGHQIFSSSLDRTVQLREATTGALGLILKGHTPQVSSTAYSPSGLQIVSGSYDGTVRLWDATTGDPGLILSGHSYYVNAVAYSPHGQQIASASHDWTVRLWDAQTGALIWMKRSIGPVYCIVYSPTGQQIASWDRERVQLWDVETGRPSQILTDGIESIRNVMYSPSGHHVVVLDFSNNVWLWDAQTGVRVLPDPLDDDTASMAYSLCGKHIAIGKSNGEVRLLDAHTGTMASMLNGHTEWVSSVAFSPNGRLIASGSHDHSLHVWDVQLGICLAKIEFVALVTKVVWNIGMNGTFIAVRSHDCAVSVCEVVDVDGLTTVLLRWTTSETRLHASSARVQNVRGLSGVNKQLLRQRGAEVIDEDEVQVDDHRAI